MHCRWCFNIINGFGKGGGGGGGGEYFGGKVVNIFLLHYEPSGITSQPVVCFGPNTFKIVE